MITVTITGDRGEGKTMLANVIARLLSAFTKYDVEYSETGWTHESKRRIEHGARDLNLEAMKNLEPTKVAVIVINTIGHPPYPVGPIKFRNELIWR